MLDPTGENRTCRRSSPYWRNDRNDAPLVTSKSIAHHAVGPDHRLRLRERDPVFVLRRTRFPRRERTFLRKQSSSLRLPVTSGLILVLECRSAHDSTGQPGRRSQRLYCRRHAMIGPQPQPRRREIAHSERVGWPTARLQASAGRSESRGATGVGELRVHVHACQRRQ